MFARCVRWIMLLSFAAHAALGCCIHHEHAGCHDQALRAGPASVSSVEKSPLSNHCCCHHSSAASKFAQPNETSLPGSEPVPEHDDDDACNEAICSFLLASPTTGQLDSTNLLLSLDWVASSPTKADLLASANIAVWRTDASRPLVSLNQFCAWQSSWQL